MQTPCDPGAAVSVVVAGDHARRFRAILRAFAEEMQHNAPDAHLGVLCAALADAWRQAAAPHAGVPRVLAAKVARLEREVCLRLLADAKALPLRVPQPRLERR